MYLSIMVVNILCAQEQIEISELKLGDSIIIITDVHKNYNMRPLPWTKEDIKYFIYEKDVNLTYKGIPIRGCVITAWKSKIAEIDFSIKLFENQEKIFALVQKKYGKMVPDFGKCDKSLAGCWYHFENDKIYISNLRLAKKQFQIKGVRTNIKISDKKYLTEYNRLDSENTERILKNHKN